MENYPVSHRENFVVKVPLVLKENWWRTAAIYFIYHFVHRNWNLNFSRYESADLLLNWAQNEQCFSWMSGARKHKNFRVNLSHDITVLLSLSVTSFRGWVSSVLEKNLTTWALDLCKWLAFELHKMSSINREYHLFMFKCLDGQADSSGRHWTETFSQLSGNFSYFNVSPLESLLYSFFA